MTGGGTRSRLERPSRHPGLVVVACIAVVAGAAIAFWWCNRPVVVGFGDSITKGRSRSGYRGSYLDYFPLSLAVVNLGKNGDTTEAGLPRLRAWLGENDADLVIVIMGTNDAVFGSLETYDEAAVVARLGAMVRSVRERGTTAVLVSPPPIVDPARKRADERLARMAPRLRELAGALRVPFVDLYAVFSKQPDVTAAFVDDGVHPNRDTGNALIAERLLPVAEQALRARREEAPAP